MTRCRCRQCMGTDEPEEQEYCADGRCGACPGCLRASDEADRGDWEFERKRDRQLEEEGNG
jgi:hypothetical protein